MADTFTPHLNLVLPEIGASRDSWGTKVNANSLAIDAYLFARTPPGGLMDFAGPTPPDGWLPCDGRAISRVDYAALYAAIGTYWGAGDGSTSFNIPDLRGRIGVGTGSVTDDGGTARGLSLAQRFGYWLVGLSQANLPAVNIVGAGDHVHSAWTDTQGNHAHTGNANAVGDHQHTYTGPVSAANQQSPGGTPGVTGTVALTSAGGGHSHSLAIDAAGNHGHNVGIGAGGAHTHALGGSNAAHENTQPSAGVTKMIFTGKVAISTAVLTQAQLAGVLRELSLGHAD